MSESTNSNVENFKQGVLNAFKDIKIGNLDSNQLVDELLQMKFGDLKAAMNGFSEVKSSVETATNAAEQIAPDSSSPSATDSATDEERGAEEDSEAAEGGSPLVKTAKAILKNENIEFEKLKDPAIISKAAQFINKKFGKNAWNIVKFYAKKKLIK